MSARIKLAEQAQLRINNGFVVDNLQLQELMAFANTVRDRLVLEEYFAAKAESNTMVADSRIFDYEDQPVVLDQKKNLYYSVVPVEYIDLPKGRGIWQISLMKDQVNNFVPVSNGFLSMTRGLDSSALQNRRGYWIEKSRIYYTGGVNANTTVLMKIVISGSAFSDEDVDFSAPEEDEKIIMRMIEVYMGERKEQVNKLNQ